MRSKTVFMFTAVFLLTVFLTACSSSQQQTVSGESEAVSGQEPGTSSGQHPLKEYDSHPYLSITYGRDNPDNFTGRDMVFYTYDIVTGELEEQCVIPFDSQYACGLVSKADNKVYYSGRSVPETLGVCDGLWVYDLETGKSSLLETDNWSYNSIAMTSSGKLLVMAATKEHPIVPALFDLETNRFTYLPEVNGEPLDLYSCGAASMFYNSATREIAYIYHNEDESYTDGYTCNEEPINTYIAVASEDLVRDPERTFAISLKVEDQVMSVAQISKNELRVLICHADIESFAWGGDLNQENRMYSLVFENGEGTLTPMELPDPKTGKWETIDGGKTFYYMGQSGEEEPKRGLFSYCAETGESTPILLGDSETGGHVISYTILNP